MERVVLESQQWQAGMFVSLRPARVAKEVTNQSSEVPVVISDEPGVNSSINNSGGDNGNGSKQHPVNSDDEETDNISLPPKVWYTSHSGQCQLTYLLTVYSLHFSILEQIESL